MNPDGSFVSSNAALLKEPLVTVAPVANIASGVQDMICGEFDGKENDFDPTCTTAPRKGYAAWHALSSLSVWTVAEMPLLRT